MDQQAASPDSLTLAPATTLHDIFPPVKKSHILNCAYPKWHPMYRSLTPKTRIIPVTSEFIDYLRADGIVLPSDEAQISSLSDSEDDDSSDDGDGAPANLDPTIAFPELHQKIKATIAELGGRVAPKLNWSSPKDAVFMTANNTSECRTPGEIYLLFKSSDFITHDLEYAFDDCIDTHEPAPADAPELDVKNIPYSLVLRKWFQLNPSMEFRCFVRGQQLLAVTQRELNHFDFLEPMKDKLLCYIQEFFEKHLKHSFPDDSFVFDVYIPFKETEKCKIWLIDINPFAPRTDPILFSWVELLRLPFGEDGGEPRPVELRLVKQGDPEAYSFSTPQYSSSKMPREVVEAGLDGDEAVWEFAARWRDVVNRIESEKAAKNGRSAA